MARRAWQAPQDLLVQTAAGGEVAIVSQASLEKAVIDAVPILDRCGGCLSVVLVREPTGFPNEMVTTHAIVEWKDRTDARPQPELADPLGGALTPPPAPQVEEEPRPLEEGGMRDQDELEVAAGLAAEAQAEAAAPEAIGDGLDAPADEVDMSSVPEHLR